MTTVRRLLKILAAGLVSLALLCAFVFLYSFSGIHIYNETGATDYKWGSGQLKTNMTEGFSAVLMDEDGFNNPDVVLTPDILIMGSSHMEAINVGRNNTAEFLKGLIPDYTVYNIGTSGHNIYTCAKNIKNAVDYYHPGKYVIVETSTVSLDNATMQEVIDGEYKTIPSYDSGLVYAIQKYCPALKTIFKNCEDWMAREKGNEDTPIADEANTTETSSEVNAVGSDMDVDILTVFLSKMRLACGDDCSLIIFYHPSTTIDCAGNLLLGTNDADVEMFSAVCEKEGIIFVNMSEQFADLYNKKSVLPYGFTNTAIGGGHLNKYGHQIIAKRLAEVIENQ